MIDRAGLIARNAPLNAFVDFAADAGGGDGPLAGVTAGVKANIAVAGLPWTAGMAARRGIVADRDAAAVALLRAAGAAILGTLNMDEAALGATTDNPWFGRTMNPHRAGHTPGGSSGGSAAAVAAALCDVALGTDTLGSIRIPAAYTGVYGLKPTHGALTTDGLVPLHPELDAVGPLARSLGMLERVWTVLRPGRGNMTVAPRAILLDRLGGVRCAPGVVAAYERVRAGFPAAEAITLPPLDRVRSAAFVAAARALDAQLAGDRAQTLSPGLCRLLDHAAAATPDPDLLAETRATLRAAIGEDGILIMPTAPQAAFPHGGRAPSDQADFTCLANIAGLPALALPAGCDADGMPVGVQLVGPPGGERLLFAAARALAAAGDPHPSRERSMSCASSSCST